MTTAKTLIGLLLKVLIAKLKPADPLAPGDCECGHLRCTHDSGKGRCRGSFPPSDQFKEWTGCSCQVFIQDDEDDDDSDDETPDVPTDPEVAELERMMR